MKIIALMGTFLVGLAIFLIRRLVPADPQKTSTTEHNNLKRSVSDQYKVIEKEGKQVGVKFDDAGHRKYFFNNN